MSDIGSAGQEMYLRVTFDVDRPLVPHFFLLLQQGVTIRSRIGCSVASFLREEIGADDAAVQRIQSIILDGRPVDDLESALVRDGATIALSAAMPGLVGATLRRGGRYSSFRSSITFHEGGGKPDQGEGLVQIKIFNLLMAELGPGLLERGIIVKSDDLFRFTSGQSPEFWEGCRRVLLDGKALGQEGLQDALLFPAGRNVILSVSSGRSEG